MDLSFLTLGVVGASLALYLFIAVRARALGTRDFYVAGGKVPALLNGMATAADWMSAASFISLAGVIAFGGFDASVYLVGWTGGYVLLAVLLAPYLRKCGTLTVPSFLGERYGSPAARALAVLCVLLVSGVYAAGQMHGVGIVFSRFLGVDLTTGVLLGMLVVMITAGVGGMKAVTYTQVAQYSVVVVAYTVPAAFLAFSLTGVPVPQLAFGAEVTAPGPGHGLYLLDALDTVLQDLGFAAYTRPGRSTLDLVAVVLALMVGTASLPHILVRFFTVPSVRDARRSVGWTLIFIALLYTTVPAVGAMARYTLTTTIQQGTIGDPQANLSYAARPDWFRHWERTGLLVVEDRNGDGRIQYYNDRDPIMQRRAEHLGWRGNELTRIDPDILVLATPEIAGLPDWVGALVAAGAVAAALSTASGLLMVMASALSHDLLKGVWFPALSDRAEIRAGRLATLGAVIGAGLLGLHPPGAVAEVVALAFGLSAATLFPALVFGVFAPSMNRQGIVAGMTVGLVFTVGYLLIFKGVVMAPLRENSAAHWLLGISPEGIGSVGMLLNTTVALVVARLTPSPPEALRRKVRDLRTPRAIGTPSTRWRGVP
ncbi:sodium:solute symporter family protein [Pararhodospirillum oryzae]|uniref:Cation acetate symporter n=1 Tax=Pararhodospirillum oryzae TaxID=478448 RepID=A0A512H6Z4_9PROT|nr:sodium:solute symporter family protein [Pararhodospirillum oryzae]GEO81223.1 cation acetate symporter [Pararhodospirillum oryzae]